MLLNTSTSDRAMRIKQVYSELDRKFEEEETQRKAKEQGLPFINLYGFPVDASALYAIPEEMAKTLQAVVFFREGRTLKLGAVAFTPQLKAFIKKLTEEQGFFVEQFIISESSFKKSLSGYGTIIYVAKKSQEIKILSTDQRYQIGSLKDLEKRLQYVSATELIETILGTALNIDSSDIHIEPERKDIKIRYRIDGVLQDVASIATELHHPIISRIKILSKLKLNIIITPQDGSFGFTFDNQPVDIRVSILPSTYGESVVMRILRQDKGGLRFEDLGIMGEALEKLLKVMNKPNGMILSTGPTGSGKTTTLYAILNKLNEPGVKIITLEDPVEYRIQGITQTPIDARAGMTFAAGLRSILRQDPDIIMVGEMRDLETAETAVQAALTGHIVLSTLHTNDAPSTIPRLIDLGVKPFILAPAINAIIAQRLVRRICEKCKEKYNPPTNLKARVEQIVKAVPRSAKTEIPTKLDFYHSTGCPACKGLGYKGRLGLYEIFTITETIEKMILKGAGTSEIKNQAIADGMITMSQDGILKALFGITDVEEVFRVTEE